VKPNVSNVIEILKPLRKQLGSQSLSYWVLPNVILTLSGARAYCDGVFWDNDKKGLLEKWNKEIAASSEVIKKSAQVVWSEVGIKEARPGEEYAGYDLIFEAGLRYVLTETSLLSDNLLIKLEEQTSAEGFSQVIVDNLKSQPQFKDLSAENLKHIAFGILAGYPDRAIVESVMSWDTENDAFADPLMDANIRGANYYICPQPVYSYPRHLVNDSSITDNEKLWSSLLEDYYTSDFHKSLETERPFQQKMQELGNLR